LISFPHGNVRSVEVARKQRISLAAAFKLGPDGRKTRDPILG
jgi:hypothetical protein